MDERAESARELAERLALAAVGAVALTAERAEALADELAERGGMRREEARQAIEELVSSRRSGATRFGERVGEELRGAFIQLGLVTREEYEELELRVAQLEHRLRLIEEKSEPQ